MDGPLTGRTLVEVFPDVEPALADRRARGRRLAVGSNAWPQLEAVDVDLGLQDHFDASTTMSITRPPRWRSGAGAW